MQTDNTINTGNNSDIININNRHEVEAMHQQWKQFSHAQILEAIKQFGPQKSAIEAHLSKEAEVL